MRQPSSVAAAGRRLFLALVLVGAGISGAAADSRDAGGPMLTSDLKARLIAASRDTKLKDWQRRFMKQLAGGEQLLAPSAPVSIESSSNPFAAGGPIDGDWAQIPPPSGRVAPALAYDPVRGRLLLVAGEVDGEILRNDSWAASLSGIADWSALAPAGAPPSERDQHTAIYDPRRDRVLVFGGLDGTTVLNDTWALSLAGTPTWSKLNPAGTPPSPRRGHTSVYDSVRDRMIVFAGSNGSALLNDVWALSLSGTLAWSQLSPSGTPPRARQQHTAIYDPIQDRMVVMGGSDSVKVRNDVWMLSLSGSPAWSAFSPPAGAPVPERRDRHTAVFDPVRDRMLVFGGQDSARVRNDTWELTLGASPAWRQLSPTGTPPTPRYWHRAVYDSLLDRMVVFGGWDGAQARNDLWALSLGDSAWRQIGTTGTPPTARLDHVAIFDPNLDGVVAFSGNSADYPFPNKTHLLSLTGIPAWDTVSTGIVAPPSGRQRAAAAYDPVRQRMLVFGGDDGRFLLNEMWALSLTGQTKWTLLGVSGSVPRKRVDPTMIYDSSHDRLIIFGGEGDTLFLNDSWVFTPLGVTGGTWSEFKRSILPPGDPDLRPSPRTGHSAICDAGRDRMIVFGGGDSSGVGRNDVWALSLSDTAWTQLAPSGDPPDGRYWHQAIYDPVRDRMVVFGGWGVTYRNDVWALSLDTPSWTGLAPGGALPSGRMDAVAVYDGPRDRMVVFGGFDGARCSDTWVLAWGTPTTPVVVCPQVPVPAVARQDTFAVRFSYSNPFPSARRFTWNVTHVRRWAVLDPVSGIDAVNGGASANVTVRLAIPDTVVQAIADTVQLSVAVFGALGSNATCQSIVVADTATALAALQCPPPVAHGPGVAFDLLYSITNPVSTARRFSWQVRSPRWWQQPTGGAIQIAPRATAQVTVHLTVPDTINLAVPDSLHYLLLDTLALSVKDLVGQAPGNIGNPSALCTNIVSADTTGTLVLAVPPVAAPVENVFALAGARPNPARRQVQVAFSLSSGKPACVELFDLSGRRVAVQTLEAPSPGRQLLNLTPARPRGPGIYLIRLTQDHRSLTSRVVLLQ